MKHAKFITDTAYKMLYPGIIFWNYVYIYEIRRNVQNQNTDLSNKEIWKKCLLKIFHLTLTHMSLAVLPTLWKTNSVFWM